MKTSGSGMIVVGALLVAALAGGTARAAAGDGSLMEVTARVTRTTSGMPAMPSRTVARRICTRPGPFDPDTLTRLNPRHRCKITHFAKQGDAITFDEVCTAPVAVTSHGTFQLTGGSNFTGSTHAAFNAGGHAITVDTDYTGKQVGTCTYHPPKESG